LEIDGLIDVLGETDGDIDCEILSENEGEIDSLILCDNDGLIEVEGDSEGLIEVEIEGLIEADVLPDFEMLGERLGEIDAEGDND